MARDRAALHSITPSHIMWLRILGYTGVTAKKEKQANKGKYSDVGSILAIVVLYIFAYHPTPFLFACELALSSHVYSCEQGEDIKPNPYYSQANGSFVREGPACTHALDGEFCN